MEQIRLREKSGLERINKIEHVDCLRRKFTSISASISFVSSLSSVKINHLAFEQKQDK